MEIAMKNINLALALVLVLLAIGLRLLPHADNFAPMTAVAIFSGVILPRKLALWVPLAAIVASDVMIGFYNTILVTWACYAIIALASSHYLRKLSFRRGLGMSLSASMFFFLLTNFATWIWSGMYAHTFAGFIQCYEMAVPFFRNSVASDLFYVGLLFGVYGLALKAGTKLQNAHLSQANL